MYPLYKVDTDPCLGAGRVDVIVVFCSFCLLTWIGPELQGFGDAVIRKTTH